MVRAYAHVCATKNCFNSRITHPTKGFFGFPKDHTLCKKWLENSGRTDLIVSDVIKSNGYYKLCSDHFDKKWFTDESMLLLNRNSKPEPTIFENNYRSSLLTRASLQESINLLELEGDKGDPAERYKCVLNPLELTVQCDSRMSINDDCIQITKKNDVGSLSITEALLNLNPNTELYSIDELCRFCMNAVKNSGKRLDLFSGDDSSKEIRKICQTLFPNKIQICDGLPHNVCETCVNDLKTCMSIIKKIKDADRYLRDVMKYSLFIDDNDEEVMRSNNEESESSCDDSVQTIPKKSLLIPFKSFNNSSEEYTIQNIPMDAKTNNCVGLVCSNIVETNKSSKDLLNIANSIEKQHFDQTSHKGSIDMSGSVMNVFKGLEVEIDADLLAEHAIANPYPNPTDTTTVKCSMCDLSGLKSKHELDTHWKQEHYFPCNLCNTILRTKKRLDRHFSKVHDTSTDCGSCGKTFKNVQARKTHEANHNVDKHVCWVCGAVLKRRDTFRVHLKSHVGPFPQKEYVQCPVCKKKLARNSLNSHLKSSHGPRVIKCDICSKCFTTHSLLRRHIKIKHTEKPEKRYKCKFCERSFCKNQSIVRHETIRLKEGLCPTGLKKSAQFQLYGIPMHECEVCGKKFYRNRNKIRHWKLHFCGEGDPEIVQKLLAEPEVHQCGICGGYLFNKPSLLNHLAHHSGKTTLYSCEFCGKTFTKALAFKIHERVHTGERPFKCKYCDRTFISSLKLFKHSKIHTTPKYPCTKCGKKFKSLEILQQHMASHKHNVPTEKAFPCYHCGKDFSTKEGLTRHVNRINHADKATALKPKQVNDNYIPEFPCEVCGKVFKFNANRQRHVEMKHKQAIAEEEAIPESVVVKEISKYELDIMDQACRSDQLEIASPLVYIISSASNYQGPSEPHYEIIM